MDILFLLFIFLAAVGIVGGSYYFYTGNKHITSFIYFGGFTTMAIIYGLQWFRSDGSLNQNASVTKWPPVVNVCPDFLSLVAITPAGETARKHVCIDTVGVAISGNGVTSPLQMNNGSLVAQGTYFDLLLNETEAARPDKLCKNCLQMGLTWEGVCSGSVAINGNPPYPAKSAAAS
jgi:hypothetical protein